MTPIEIGRTLDTHQSVFIDECAGDVFIRTDEAAWPGFRVVATGRHPEEDDRLQAIAHAIVRDPAGELARLGHPVTDWFLPTP